MMPGWFLRQSTSPVWKRPCHGSSPFFFLREDYYSEGAVEVDSDHLATRGKFLRPRTLFPGRGSHAAVADVVFAGSPKADTPSGCVPSHPLGPTSGPTLSRF